MKLKFIKFIAACSIAATAVIGMASFVAADEDGEEARWRVEVSEPCQALCAVQRSDGTWDTWMAAGTIKNCPRSSTQSSCEQGDCRPSSPCK